MIYKSEWFKKVCDSGKKFVIVAGASSSGKSFVSNELSEYYQKQGKRCKVISADNYYKGIARTIVQKALLNNNYDNVVKIKFKDICSLVKQTIKDTPFPQKMCEQNTNKIEIGLTKLFDKDLAKKLTKEIKTEFENINFDEPFAVDLKSLANDINKLSEGKSIIVPDYSFKTGEVEYYEKNKVDPKDYDVYVIEGIYALLDEVVENIKTNDKVLSAIDCDLKTLISRKLDRDITKGRSTLTPEQTVISYLSQVIPSYYKYIYPSFKNADLVLKTTLTDDETKSRTHIKQQKYISTDYVYDYLSLMGFDKKVCNQTDYFLEDSSNKNNMVLRIREENGKANKITLKSSKDIDNLDRYVEEYDISNFSDQNRDIGNILQKFIDSGFYLSTMIHKTRTIYEKEDITVKVDDLGLSEKYLEIDVDDNKKEKYDEIVNKLGLKSEINKSYYQIVKQKPITHDENEKKYVVKGDVTKFAQSKNLAGHVIHQHYLDLDYVKNIRFIEQFVGKNQDLSEFSEARLRFVDNKKCYLTLKSSGSNSRVEFEKEIPLSLVNLEKLALKGSIKKVRYDILDNGEYVVSLDYYLDRKLAVCEVEYNTLPMSEQTLVKILDGLQVEDVTFDTNYKNSHLAK